MGRPTRVFMTGRSVASVQRRAREKYTQHVIVNVKLDKNKPVPKSARIRGYPNYYRVYMKKRE